MQVVDPRTGASKQINMCRNGSEQMGDFVNRLKASLAKVAAKGSKLKKKEQVGPAVEVNFFRGAEAADPTGQSALDFFTQPGLRIRLEIPLEGNSYQVYVNPPMITKGKFSEAVLSGFPFYPSRLEFENAQSDKTKFEWFVSTEKFPPNEAASDSKKAKPEALQKMADKLTWVRI